MVPIEIDRPSWSVMISVASLSRTFQRVRCKGCGSGVSLSLGYLVSKPGGSGRSSAQPPFGHQPPHAIWRSMATSSAARSTPVWPPLMIFMDHHCRADRGIAMPRRRSIATNPRYCELLFGAGFLEGLHRLGEPVEPGHQVGVSGAPFAFVADIEVAERRRQGQVSVVRARRPGGRVRLEIIQRTIDLGALAVHPGLVPLLLGAEALLVDQQQCGIENAVGERGKDQRFPALGASLGKQLRRWRQAVEVLADHRTVVDALARLQHQRWNLG